MLFSLVCGGRALSHHGSGLPLALTSNFTGSSLPRNLAPSTPFPYFFDSVEMGTTWNPPSPREGFINAGLFCGPTQRNDEPTAKPPVLTSLGSNGQAHNLF